MKRLGRAAALAQTVAAVVVGEPGIGKSELLAEAHDRVSLPQAFCAAAEPEEAVPLAAGSELLRALQEAKSCRA